MKYPGYEPDAETVDAGGKITNTQETVEIEVKKVWASPVLFQPDSVTVKLYKKIGSGDKTQVGSDVTLSDPDWSYEWTGLPKYGKDSAGDVTAITYTVEEYPVPTSYTVAYDPAAGYTGASGTITVTNKPVTGDLELSKVLVSDLASDKDVTFSFRVELSKLDNKAISGAYGDMKFTDGVATVELKGGETATATGLPTTVTYTITEANATGFQLTGQTGDTGTITTKPSTATFTNTRDTGDLTVSKKVVSSTTADKNVQFTFTVTLYRDAERTEVATEIDKKYGDMTFNKGVATFTLKDGESATATGLPTTLTYEVVETANDAFVTTKTGNTGSITTSGATAAFTNTKKEGGLIISKEVVSALPADKEATYTITITLSDTSLNETYKGKIVDKEVDVKFENGVATVELKDTEAITIKGLPAGLKAIISEEAPDGLKATYDPANGEVTIPNGDAATATVAVTNTRDTGDLKLSKKLISDLAADKDVEFTFTVTLDPAISGTFGDMTFTDGKATVKLKGGESAKATGLPTTLKYEITEAKAEGFKVTGQTGDTGTISTTLSEAEFENTRDTGDLELSKVLVSDLAADADVEFEFTVTLGDTTINGTYGDMTFTDGVATVKLKGGESATAKGLPTTLTYTITEASAEGFQVTGKTGDTGSISTTLSEAEFENTRETGDLELSKVLVSDLAADADVEFEFTVTLGDKTINGTYGDMTFTDGVATVKLKGGESATAKGLPTTLTYTITEADAEGFELTGKTNDTGSISTTPSEAEFTNTALTTQLKVTKTWDDKDNQDGKRPSDATVQLYKTVDGVKSAVTGKTATVPAKDGEVITWTGLPVYEGGKKITYSVVETLPDGTEYTTSGDDVTLEAKKDDTGAIAITNSYEPETTKIMAIKHWNDNSESGKPRKNVQATFHLQKTVDGVSTEIDSVEVGKEQSWIYTWTDLPVYENGKKITYSVKEVLTKANGNGGKITITNTLRDETPGTGDNTKTLLWGGLTLTSAIGCGGALWIAGRRKKKEEQ